MATTKSPYEIRLEVLQMAKDFLDKQAKLNSDIARDAFDAAVKINKATIEQWKQYAPVGYTMEDILSKATDLYKFVTTNK